MAMEEEAGGSMGMSSELMSSFTVGSMSLRLTLSKVEVGGASGTLPDSDTLYRAEPTGSERPRLVAYSVGAGSCDPIPRLWPGNEPSPLSTVSRA